MKTTLTTEEVANAISVYLMLKGYDSKGNVDFKVQGNELKEVLLPDIKPYQTPLAASEIQQLVRSGIL